VADVIAPIVKVDVEALLAHFQVLPPVTGIELAVQPVGSVEVVPEPKVSGPQKSAAVAFPASLCCGCDCGVLNAIAGGCASDVRMCCCRAFALLFLMCCAWATITMPLQAKSKTIFFISVTFYEL
jgi:hypothetical protein